MLRDTERKKRLEHRARLAEQVKTHINLTEAANIRAFETPGLTAAARSLQTPGNNLSRDVVGKKVAAAKTKNTKHHKVITQKKSSVLNKKTEDETDQLLAATDKELAAKAALPTRSNG